MRRLAPLRWPADAPPDLDEPRVFVHDLVGAPDRGLLKESARTVLREILSAYSGQDPLALAIEPAACVHCGEAHGKPHLPDFEWLRFNLSHSGQLAVIAVAEGREVGVDVEVADGGRRVGDVAARFFAPSEAGEVRRLGDAAFYRLWTRKEAYLKATAEGLAAGLDSIDANELEALPGWEFADLDLGDGYAGALAAGPPGFRPTAPAGAVRRTR